MKKAILLFAALCFVGCASEPGAEKQVNSGVNFHDLSFEQVLENAGKMDKLVMVDAWSAG